MDVKTEMNALEVIDSINMAGIRVEAAKIMKDEKREKRAKNRKIYLWW